MNLLLEIIFIALVIADTILTYRVLERGGREKKYWQIFGIKLPTLMGICIGYPALTIAITIAGAGFLMLFLAYAQCTWVLVFPSIAFGYACWRSWRNLKWTTKTKTV
jgi:hypothetical protein